MGSQSQRRYVEIPLPGGFTYEDDSRDLLAAIEHPSLYPTDPAKVDLHVDGLDIALTRAELVAVQTLLPTAISWLDSIEEHTPGPTPLAPVPSEGS